jgi:hypothetical protein
MSIPDLSVIEKKNPILKVLKNTTHKVFRKSKTGATL